MVGREVDGGGGMRKGTGPEELGGVDDVDDIRAMGNDGVWGRRGLERPLDESV